MWWVRRRRPAQRPGSEPGRGLRGGRRLSGEDHPFFALAASRRAQRGEGALDAEGRGEVAADIGLRHPERRAGGGGAQGEEGREEPASFAQDAGDGADVFSAAGGVDGAEAGVLPDAVEGVDERGVAVEREDVTLQELDGDAVALCERPGRGERGGREVHGHHGVATRGEVPRVMTAPASGHEHAPTRGRRRLHEVDEGGCSAAHLPAVTAAGIEIFPEGGRAHTGHANPSKLAMARSAPASMSSRPVWAVVTPITRMPALRAACTPTSASSKTRHSAVRSPSPSAARRYTSGFGLPQRTSSAATTTSKRSRSPSSPRSRCTSERVAEVATARLTPSRSSSATKADTPGIACTPRATRRV